MDTIPATRPQIDVGTYVADRRGNRGHTRSEVSAMGAATVQVRWDDGDVTTALAASLTIVADCTHPAPIEFGMSDVPERRSGEMWAHLPCGTCGEYRVWTLEPA